MWCGLQYRGNYTFGTGLSVSGAFVKVKQYNVEVFSPMIEMKSTSWISAL